MIDASIDRHWPDVENQKTTDRLVRAMEVAAMGMWDWDVRKNEVYFDDRCYSMAGYTPGEFPATFDAWRARVHPDDLNEIDDALKRLACGQAETSSSRFRIKARNGDWISVLGRGCVHHQDESGTPLRIIGTRIDISDPGKAEPERQRPANQYRQVVEKAHDGIVIAQDRKFRYANPGMARITGYTRDELTGMAFVGLLHPSDSEMVLNRHVQRLHGKQLPDYYSFRAKDKQGKEIWLEINTELFDWNDRPAILCIVRDITYSKAMEHQLLQAQKIQAIGTLAGGIAHDFNNILSAMMGFTELCLAEATPGSKAAHRMGRVMQAGQRARELVSQILTFSRQEETNQKPTNMAVIIKEAMKLIKASTPSTVRFEIRIDKDTGIVMANPTHIHQIIMNLCVNATHAMRDKGGVIQVELSNCEVEEDGFISQIKGLTPGAHVLLTVSDTGHGMDRETMKMIFDPYFTTKGRGEGTGLGLSVVHGIVASLGGAVSVYSEPGEGTAFHVYLPRLDSGKDASEATKRHAVAGGKETILLVDDEELIVEMTGEMLEGLGYTVVSRTSSIEAFRAFTANPRRFDLVITDHTMPGMTGLELAEKIGASCKPAPVVLCSGFSTDISEDRARGIGIRAILNKPILKREMAETIRRVLD